MDHDDSKTEFDASTAKPSKKWADKLKLNLSSVSKIWRITSPLDHLTSKPVIIGLIAIAFLLFLTFMFPTVWARFVWKKPVKPPGISSWEYAEMMILEDDLPKWIYPEEYFRNNGKPLVLQLMNAQVSHWNGLLGGKTPNENVSVRIPPIPLVAFGISSAIRPEFKTWTRIQNPYSEEFMNDSSMCRVRSIVNHAELVQVDPLIDWYHPVEVRAVCPCTYFEDRWSYFSDVAIYSFKTKKLTMGAGMYSDKCVYADPLALLNRPPQWMECQGFLDLSAPPKKRYMLKDLRCLEAYTGEGKLPPWRIYVEENKRFRRAKKKDLKYISKGIFTIP